MNNIYKRELAANIIDIFEDWLDKKGVKIENEERDKDDPDNEANIWGSDFDELMDDISSLLFENGIHISDNYNEGEDGAMIGFRHQFIEAILDETLPDVGCFNVYIKNMADDCIYETQGDKPSELYTWKEFYKWLVDDVKELISPDVNFADLEILEVQFAGTDGLYDKE